MGRKSRKAIEKGRKGAAARVVNPAHTCLFCTELIQVTSREPAPMGRVQPCGHENFHFRCLRRWAARVEAIGGGAFMERCPVCRCDGSTHIESVGKSGVRSRLSLPLPESEHELVAQQRDALEGEGEYSDDIQSLAGDEEGEDREQRERELAAQQRRRAERRARHVVEHQEHEWRQGVMCACLCTEVLWRS